MMLDWNLYPKQLTATIGQIATASPEIVRGYRALSEAGRTTGKVDAKTRELIALGVAVTGNATAALPCIRTLRSRQAPPAKS